jgi:hypothetical protein
VSPLAAMRLSQARRILVLFQAEQKRRGKKWVFLWHLSFPDNVVGFISITSVHVGVVDVFIKHISNVRMRELFGKVEHFRHAYRASDISHFIHKLMLVERRFSENAGNSCNSIFNSHVITFSVGITTYFKDYTNP